MSQKHAVVLGAGMGGLLAARVLSERYERVTILERDLVPDQPDPRRGVPQGGHVHGFQARGVEVVDELFPGLVDELVNAGASRLSDLSDIRFNVGGHVLCQQPQPITPVLSATRPFLEQSVRNRVVAMDGVRLLDGVEAVELVTTRDRTGEAVVTGVLTSASTRHNPHSRGLDRIDADLVVDATGRGSRTPAWLEGLDYARPSEDRIAVRVRYVSQTLRLPRDHYPVRFVIEGRTPRRALGAALFFCEEDRWVFTVLGAAQAVSGSTREWMLEVSRGVLPDWAHAAVSAAEPLSPVVAHGHAASLRRRYDLLRRLPERLVVLGDAACAFNPIYGQGMSVAAEQALVLRDLLGAGDHAIGLRLAQETSALSTAVWNMAAGSDLAYPEVTGNPTASMRLASRYIDAVLGVAEHDPEVARRFMAVSGLVAPRSLLFERPVLVPVLRSLLRRPSRGVAQVHEAVTHPTAAPAS